MPIVPPGHRVDIAYPSPNPYFAPTQSGPMMLNFGSVEYVPAGLAKLAEFVRTAKEQQSVVWLMPANILPAFDDAPALLEQIANLVASAPLISHLAVFPGSSPLLDRVMASFEAIGINTQRGAPDGACYVEVHKPDGSIVVGIPGPDSPVAESEPRRDIDTLIKDIADHERENDLLELFSRLPTLPLFILVVGPFPENLPRGERITLEEDLPLECRTASVQGLECALAFTSPGDPSLDPERVVVIDGLVVLQMVLKSAFDGLLIQSGKGSGWVVIHRKQIEEILSQQPKPSLNKLGRLFARIFSKPKRK